MRAILLGVAVGALLSCGGSASSPSVVTVRMDFARADLYSAPWPSDDLVSADGHVDLSKFPNPSQNVFLAQITSLLTRDARGFSTTGGAFLSLTGDVDPASLPDLPGSVAPGASVALVSLDALAKVPAWVSFTRDGGDYGGARVLSIVPLQGVALRPKARYAAVVTTGVRDLHGASLAQGAEMSSVARGVRPSAMPEPMFVEYTQALDALEKAGVARAKVAGLAVFTTGDPTAQTRAVMADVGARPLPVPAAFTPDEVFDGYCVYESQVAMPDYQSGAPPFTTSGGDWAFDAAGKVIEQRREPARLVVTVPRSPMPAAGYPLTLMVRTGGGGDRPLVDRGVQAVHDGPPITPGSGPAMELAKVGFAGAQIDGPHGGLRNVTHDDEQFLMFNVSNGAALRDNVRESAVELVVAARMLLGGTLDASKCPGASPVAKFDPSRLALLGHSMGATISPLVLALEPDFKAAILSGAGASWIENILYKEQPVPVRPLIELLLGYSSSRRHLVRSDPVLSLVQWALEPADPLVYGASLGETQILMEQGIVDHYILPPIADATPLSAGLDLAGAALDTASPELAARPELYPLSSVMGYAGLRAVTFPVSGNRQGKTRVVVQHPADGVEDGHEVMFQTEPPKREYRCFLRSFASGGPAIVPDGDLDAPCP